MSASTHEFIRARRAILNSPPPAVTLRSFTVSVTSGKKLWVAKACGHCRISRESALDAAETLATFLLGHEEYAAFFADYGRQILIQEMEPEEEDVR